jgi:hypothetical protein
MTPPELAEFQNENEKENGNEYFFKSIYPQLTKFQNENEKENENEYSFVSISLHHLLTTPSRQRLRSSGHPSYPLRGRRGNDASGAGRISE